MNQAGRVTLLRHKILIHNDATVAFGVIIIILSVLYVAAKLGDAPPPSTRSLISDLGVYGAGDISGKILMSVRGAYALRVTTTIPIRDVSDSTDP